MSTQDVPGANPANVDTLAAGAWAEHADGSLLFVKGNEAGTVIYELFDTAQQPAVYYQDAMREGAFKLAFSFPPVGTSAEKWTWHDKTPMPWSRVMKMVERPVPVHADVHDTLSAAARVAQSLRLRAQRLSPEDVSPRTEQTAQPRIGSAIVVRIQKALDALIHG